MRWGNTGTEKQAQKQNDRVGKRNKERRRTGRRQGVGKGGDKSTETQTDEDRWGEEQRHRDASQRATAKWWEEKYTAMSHIARWDYLSPWCFCSQSHSKTFSSCWGSHLIPFPLQLPTPSWEKEFPGLPLADSPFPIFSLPSCTVHCEPSMQPRTRSGGQGAPILLSWNVASHSTPSFCGDFSSMRQAVVAPWTLANNDILLWLLKGILNLDFININFIQIH